MRRMTLVRPFVCVLLAVSTAVGTTPVAAKACGCPAAPRPAVPTPAAAPVHPAPCCDAGKPSCCPPVQGKKATCCGQAEKPAAPACECLHCECGTTDAPNPVEPTVPPAHADVVSAEPGTPPPAPPVFLPLPTTDRPPEAAFATSLPPPDLVTTLSRLTC